MSWVPESAWLTKLQIDTSAADLAFDLAVDTSGRRDPSTVAAGLELPDAGSNLSTIVWALSAAAAAALIVAIAVRLDRPWPARR